MKKLIYTEPIVGRVLVGRFLDSRSQLFPTPTFTRDIITRAITKEKLVTRNYRGGK